LVHEFQDRGVHLFGASMGHFKKTVRTEFGAAPIWYFRIRPVVHWKNYTPQRKSPTIPYDCHSCVAVCRICTSFKKKITLSEYTPDRPDYVHTTVQNELDNVKSET